MKVSIFSILLILFLQPLQLLAQKSFTNQGEQEDFWATELFKNSYSKQTFEKFSGKITQLNNYQIKYDSTVLNVFTPTLPIKRIFLSGIFYPSIFEDPRILDPAVKTIRLRTMNNPVMPKPATDSSTLAKNAHFLSLLQNDTISISVIEEVAFLSNSPKIKRFRMWINHKWIQNPTIYFFELTNDNATNNTNLDEFIKGSSLTFVRKGWLII